jgi:hypothetical protein
MRRNQHRNSAPALQPVAVPAYPPGSTLIYNGLALWRGRAPFEPRPHVWESMPPLWMGERRWLGFTTGRDPHRGHQWVRQLVTGPYAALANGASERMQMSLVEALACIYELGPDGSDRVGICFIASAPVAYPSWPGYAVFFWAPSSAGLDVVSYINYACGLLQARYQVQLPFPPPAGFPGGSAP